jgi:strictosidine synthase
LIFTSNSNVPEKALIGPLALNEKLSGASKLFENQIKGPEGLIYYNNTLYSTIHLGNVIKIVDDQIIPIAKFGKPCGM